MKDDVRSCVYRVNCLLCGVTLRDDIQTINLHLKWVYKIDIKTERTDTTNTLKANYSH